MNWVEIGDVDSYTDSAPPACWHCMTGQLSGQLADEISTAIKQFLSVTTVSSARPDQRQHQCPWSTFVIMSIMSWTLLLCLLINLTQILVVSCHFHCSFLFFGWVILSNKHLCYSYSLWFYCKFEITFRRHLVFKYS